MNSPTIPIIFNCNASLVSDPEEIKNMMVKQINNPVQWIKTIKKLAENNVSKIIETGPGKVLTGLNKRIDKGLTYLISEDAEIMEKLK